MSSYIGLHFPLAPFADQPIRLEQEMANKNALIKRLETQVSELQAQASQLRQQLQKSRQMQSELQMMRWGRDCNNDSKVNLMIVS